MTSAPLGQPQLVDRIRREIAADGPRTFARFMELALHDPCYGYYAAGAERLGERGDFITAGDLGPAFGRALARQIVELDRVCGQPDPFDVVEFGAGRGLLARDLLSAAGERVRYTAIDASEGMRRSIATQAPQAIVAAKDTARPAGRGCVLAVELFDALPVHRLVRRAGRLEEIGVDWDGERFVEVVLEPREEVRAWSERYGAAALDGHEAEVCLGLEQQFERFDRALERGFALVFDYGDSADRLYTPERKRGTLLAYSEHRASEGYLERVGLQDLTAHVNFTALVDAAGSKGWRLVGRTTQDRFLIANGILEEFERMDDAAYRDPRRIEERWRTRQLIQPGGMGRRFHLLIFCKGLARVAPLAGLVDPFAG